MLHHQALEDGRSDDENACTENDDGHPGHEKDRGGDPACDPLQQPGTPQAPHRLTAR
jgi:hypothetical protein